MGSKVTRPKRESQISIGAARAFNAMAIDFEAYFAGLCRDVQNDINFGTEKFFTGAAACYIYQGL